MKNYKILRDVLTNVGIKDFNPEKAKAIQNEKKGEIQRLLYQIRSCLEKKGINHENVSHKKSIFLIILATVLEEKYSSMKIRKKRGAYDELSQKHYEFLMERNTLSQKEVNLKKHLSRFDEFHKSQELKIRRAIESEEKAIIDERSRKIEMMKNEAVRYHSFNQKFDQEGIENWKKNVISKKEREMRDLDFQMKEAKDFKDRIDRTINRYEIETITKIENFEQNLEETTCSENPMSDASIPNNQRIVSVKNNILDRITTKILKDPVAKTERDRRRRKIIVEQSKAQLEIENRTREEQLKSKLFKQSNQEKQLTYELYRADQIKYIVRDNRELRKIQYDEQNLQVQKFYKENEEHFLTQHIECFESDKAKEDQRLKELHISMRQKQRSVNSQACKDMVELIVDIVEEAYTYQQINDTEEIDERVWREWTQLFINDHSLFNTGLANRNLLSRQSDKMDNDGILSEGALSKTSFYSTSPYTLIDRTLDDTEFMDYINYNGQWNKSLIPQSAFNKLNLNDFIENNVQTNIKGKNVQITKEDIRDDDTDNLVIPKENIKNPYLGNLIDILIEIKHEDDYNEPRRKNLFKYIPIKLALIGQDFSGKKTQAKILSENFPFKIYSIDKVLEDAFNLHKRLEAPNETETKFYRSTQRMQVLEERKEEEAKYAQIKELVSQIKVLLKTGEPIPDDIYVDLLVEFIKIDFPDRSEEDIVQEAIMRVNEKEEILEKMKENDRENKNRPQTHKDNYNLLQQNLLRANLDAMQGIVIVNFPNTYNQAKLLEKKLSGYIFDKPITQANMLKENLAMLVDKSDPILPPSKLIRGGLDYVFYLNSTYQECIRRAIGRRIDPTTGTIYHLDNNVPSTDSNICEKLIPIEDTKNIESLLSIRSLSFTNTINYLVEFYEPFGFDKQKINMFNEIDGNKNREDVTNDLIENINKIVQINEENDLDIWNKHEANVVEEDSRILSEFADVSEDEREDEDEYTKNTKRINKIKKKINRELASVLLNIVIKMFETYIVECKDIFKFLRWQRDHISRNYDLILQKFINFLKKPSMKQTLLLEYQHRYNHFLDTYPDLVDDKNVKEEHHQQVDDLNDKIYEIIEKRRHEALDERKSIMTSGWIENEMEKFYLNLEKLYQAEIDRFISSMIIIRDYYHNLDNRPLVELPFMTIDIVKDEVDSGLALENENDFPKVDKLYKSAIKVIFQYDQAVAQAERERNNKNAEKDNKTKAKTPAKPKTQVENSVIELYPYEEEMKTALKNEKFKYKFRITLLKYWGIDCLRKFRSQANQIYNKLEDWILLSNRSENQALDKVTDILRNNIEREEKIKYELSLDVFDVIVNKDVQNYIEMPPELSPAKEVISHERFNIEQIVIFTQELEAYTSKPSWIKTSVLLDLLIKKFVNSFNLDYFY
jgi:hypothetical protein